MEMLDSAIVFCLIDWKKISWKLQFSECMGGGGEDVFNCVDGVKCRLNRNGGFFKIKGCGRYVTVNGKKINDFYLENAFQMWIFL